MGYTILARAHTSKPVLRFSMVGYTIPNRLHDHHRLQVGQFTNGYKLIGRVYIYWAVVQSSTVCETHGRLYN